MLDIRTALADAQSDPDAASSPTHVAIRREDYRPPDWLIPEIRLDFDLDPERTRVRASLDIVRNGTHDRPLRLDGDDLKLLSVTAEGEHRMDGSQLVVEIAGDRATIQTEDTMTINGKEIHLG